MNKFQSEVLGKGQEEQVSKKYVTSAPDQNKGIPTKHTQVFCPISTCKAKFPPPWDLYVIGTNPEGLAVYQCPECKGQFTVADLSVNAVRVQNLPNTLFIWYDSIRHKRLFEVHSSTIFTDGEFHYIHVPVLILNNSNTRLFSVGDKEDPNAVDAALKTACMSKKPNQLGNNNNYTPRQGEVIFNK